MAKKTSKKTEEQVINEVEITETVQETVKEEKQFEPEVQEVVDTIMEKIEENTPETTEPEEFLEKEISMGEEITEIQEDFKDTSARLEELVNNTKTEKPSVKVESDALCYCIYTSGSTGKPQGTLL